MNKLYTKISNKKRTELLKKITKELGCPYICKNISIYAENNLNYNLSLSIENKKTKYKITPKSGDINSYRYIEIHNKNLKDLFRSLYSLGFQEGTIGTTNIHNFYEPKDIYIKVLKNTFIGDQIQIEYADVEEFNDSKIKKLLEEEKLVLRKKIDTQSSRIKKDTIMNSFGVLNSKINDYASKEGLDINNNNFNLREKILNKSNDYSYLEQSYEEITNSKLLSEQSLQNEELFEPVSIIIPSYNSEDTIIKTLYSIQSQQLSEKNLSKIEVVVVDDGSESPVKSFIKKHEKNFKFRLSIVRLENNKGLSTARNAGLHITKAQNIVFIDSDVLLPKNYILEQVVRSKLIPNSVFVSFKKNISKTDELCTIEQISKGLPVPNNFDDLRIHRQLQKNQPGLYEVTHPFCAEILSDTDHFKTLGFGRKIGIFDLSSMVIGHNICLRRKTIEEANEFSHEFVGWGLEDSYFGSKVIANGNFVIPVISTGVYHIEHPPRSGSEKKKKEEFNNNLQIYKNLLCKNIKEN